jgi:peptidoglycan/LPS O-acetylase OafA/YrhL
LTDAAAARAPTKAHGRIDDIEVLRAFAVGMVLVEHARFNLIPWVWGVREPLYKHFGYWSGVDLFLVISGFVIARSLLPLLDAAQSRTEFFRTTLAFWLRRAFRLLPSAWLWLAVVLVCAAMFNSSGAFQPLRIDVEAAIAAVLNIANFRIAYVLHAHPGQPLGAPFPYWSLSLEEQFYLVLPLLVLLARRRLPIVLAVIVLAQLFLPRSGPTTITLLNQTRSDALALGVLLMIWSSQPSYSRLEPTALRPWPVRLLLPPVLIALFAFASGNPYTSGPFSMGVAAVFSAMIVWIASYDRGYIFPPGRLKRALCWMGARSYAIYLIHIPAYFATREIWFRVRPDVLNPGWSHLAVLLATALPLLFLAADLNYRLVETPLRRYGARLADRIRRREPSFAAAVVVRGGYPGGRAEDTHAAQ